jgi:hypothetical protein
MLQTQVKHKDEAARLIATTLLAMSLSHVQSPSGFTDAREWKTILLGEGYSNAGVESQMAILVHEFMHVWGGQSDSRLYADWGLKDKGYEINGDPNKGPITSESSSLTDFIADGCPDSKPKP